MPAILAEWLATLAEKRQTGVALSRDLNLQLPQLIQQERKAQRTVPQTTEPDSTATRLPACLSREQNKLLFVSANVALVSTNTAPPPALRIESKLPASTHKTPLPAWASLRLSLAKVPPFHIMSPVTPLQPSPVRFFFCCFFVFYTALLQMSIECLLASTPVPTSADGSSLPIHVKSTAAHQPPSFACE